MGDAGYLVYSHQFIDPDGLYPFWLLHGEDLICLGFAFTVDTSSASDAT